jgi:hypothetical protein
LSGDLFFTLNIYMENNTTPLQITINDLILIKELVEVACSRGAFRANEMTSVGEVYDRLTVFLNTVIVSNQNEATQNGEAE